MSLEIAVSNITADVDLVKTNVATLRTSLDAANAEIATLKAGGTDTTAAEKALGDADTAFHAIFTTPAPATTPAPTVPPVIPPVVPPAAAPPAG